MYSRPLTRRTCGVQRGKRTYPRKVIGQKGPKHGPRSKNSGIHYFRVKIDIALNSADKAIKWAPAVSVNNNWDMSKQFTYYRIKFVQLHFVPLWSAAQPEVQNNESDPVSTCWYRYLSWGRPDPNENAIKDMENSRRTQMVGKKVFTCYDLSNADMRTSKSDDPNNTLAFEHLKIHNHCWRKFNEEIPWFSMAFDFDEKISDDYECFFVVHIEVKNYENAHAVQGEEFAVKVTATSAEGNHGSIGIYGQSRGTKGDYVQYSNMNV